MFVLLLAVKGLFALFSCIEHWMTKLEFNNITASIYSGQHSSWGSKRINPLPHPCLCLTWSGCPLKRRQRFYLFYFFAAFSGLQIYGLVPIFAALTPLSSLTVPPMNNVFRLLFIPDPTLLPFQDWMASVFPIHTIHV